jgi:hypothetical protein
LRVEGELEKGGAVGGGAGGEDGAVVGDSEVVDVGVGSFEVGEGAGVGVDGDEAPGAVGGAGGDDAAGAIEGVGGHAEDPGGLGELGVEGADRDQGSTPG